jgi:hypothetical protein
MGKRIHIGLYRRANGTLVHADLNGVANISRSLYPQHFNVDDVDSILRPKTHDLGKKSSPHISNRKKRIGDTVSRPSSLRKKGNRI